MTQQNPHIISLAIKSLRLDRHGQPTNSDDVRATLEHTYGLSADEAERCYQEAVRLARKNLVVAEGELYDELEAISRGGLRVVRLPIHSPPGAIPAPARAPAGFSSTRAGGGYSTSAITSPRRRCAPGSIKAARRSGRN